MTAEVKVVRGTIGDAKVETSEENAARLGSTFTPEKSAPAKKAASKSDSK